MVAGDGLGVEQAAQDAFLHTLGHRPEQRVDGIIVEQGDAHQVIEHPREERTRQFLARYSEG